MHLLGLISDIDYLMNRVKDEYDLFKNAGDIELRADELAQELLNHFNKNRKYFIQAKRNDHYIGHGELYFKIKRAEAGMSDVKSSILEDLCIMSLMCAHEALRLKGDKSYILSGEAHRLYGAAFARFNKFSSLKKNRETLSGARHERNRIAKKYTQKLTLEFIKNNPPHLCAAHNIAKQIESNVNEFTPKKDAVFEMDGITPKKDAVPWAFKTIETWVSKAKKTIINQ